VNKNATKATKAAMARPKKAAPKIAKTQFDDKLGEKLRWHFGSVEADASLRSSQGPLVDMALSGPPTGGTGARDANMAKGDTWHSRNDAHRRIHHALTSLLPEHQRALERAYGEERFALEAYAQFPSLGACAGVVLLSSRAKAAFDREVEQRRAKGQAKSNVRAFVARGVGEWLRGPASSEARKMASDEGVKLLSDARAAFSVAYDKGKEAAAKIRKTAIARAPLPAPLELPRRTSLG
jgi:hypothetical protein